MSHRYDFFLLLLKEQKNTNKKKGKKSNHKRPVDGVFLSYPKPRYMRPSKNKGSHRIPVAFALNGDQTLVLAHLIGKINRMPLIAMSCRYSTVHHA